MRANHMSHTLQGHTMTINSSTSRSNVPPALGRADLAQAQPRPHDPIEVASVLKPSMGS